MKKKLFFAVSIIFFTQAIEKKRLEKITATSKLHKTFVEGQKAFELIKKMWNAEGSTIDDVNNYVINHKVNNSINNIKKILHYNIQAIPSTEIMHLITTIKNLKAGYVPISNNLSSDTKARLVKIFDKVSRTYKKLLKSQDIVEKNNISAEIIGIGVSYTQLADTFLATIANALKEYNNLPIITPLSSELKHSVAEKKADKQIKDLKAKLAVAHD